ncbi:glucosamine-6-phosphate deaminase [Halanaerobium saccharolyticum]|uniref:Glucosamine-6-phosphate deaminase n=1 Tax=Halanaerobium saccharolyticum TaxID=43595 RepID=A0A4R6LKE6_9FIRM|nr:glucosamine-6-phosphate deaminase [Halanaerobium saccharolyticum]TDO83411.1 glucosamine-6-phosphate deaminase [Halanaerobium saccharolyticum]
MRIIVEKNYQAMSKKAALMVASQITLKPDSNLGLATGGTPLGMYNNLIEMYQNDEIDFSEVQTFNLDEYYGLKADHPNSYHHYMFENLFNEINIQKENIHIPDGTAEDSRQECRKYEKSIKKARGIDLQILGIGSNGHIGFNEPAENLNVATEVVDLTEETIKANSRYFESKDEVPRKAISMGMATILKADRIVLLASGKSKAEAIKKTVSGQISTQVPATLLQTHPEITILLDQEAASLINKDDLSADCHFEICE